MSNYPLDITCFSDETWFHIPGYVNSKNMRTWNCGVQKILNSHYCEETPLHPQKIGVWWRFIEDDFQGSPSSHL